MTGRALETLPVGFRFCPTDEELIDHYLKSKKLGMDSHADIIPEIDVCKYEPWKLPDFSMIKTDDPEWFFFSLLDCKYSKGSRSNRATKAGYWKPTGHDRDIKSGTNKIGTKKTLVFYRGRARTALRTDWVIHEFHADIAGLPANRAYVLCRLKRKTHKNTGSDIPAPNEAVADTGIHQNGLANNMTLGAGPSHHASNIASDNGNYQVEEMTSDVDPQLQGLLNDFTFTPPDSDWFSDTDQGLDLDLLFPSGFNNSYGSNQFQDGVDTEFADSLICDRDEFHCEGLSGQRSSAVYSGKLNHVVQGFCLQAKDSADYGSATYLPQNKSPIRESKKDYKVAEKANPKPSSIWNEPVGSNRKRSFSSPQTVSANHEPSSSPGYLVNLLVGMLLFLVLIAVMVLGINAKV